MKHKHYNCIVAWAEGKDIEIKNRATGEWIYDEDPEWDSYREYRIKKESVIEVKYFERVTYRDGSFYKVFYKEFTPDLEKWELKITYKDGKAIKAEVSE